MTQKTVSVIGAGLIGCSWAAYFAVHGLAVRIFDVRDDYEDTTAERVRSLAAELPHSKVDEAMTRVSFFTSLEEAVQGADLVQENGPEKPEIKARLFADLEKLADPDTLLVSSSSGIPPELLGAEMSVPERAMIGHPFNPAHLLPVVEICASPEAPVTQVDRLTAFYRDCGRLTATLKKPIAGFVINRLQAAMVREAIAIVEEGVVDAQELDNLVMGSLGVRWASVGPFLTGQLGGGAGGFRGIAENILSTLFAAMDLPPMSKETLDLLEAQTTRGYPMEKIDAFARARDARQLAILDIQNRNPLPGS